MIDFNELVGNYLSRTSSPRQVGRYYPSQIGSCLRKVWYSYLYPVETSAELTRVFELGNMLHEFIVRVIQSDKNPTVELLESEFPFRCEIDDFTISGRIDDLVLVKADSKKVLVEVKSTSNSDYVTEPHASHAMQLQLYLHFFGIDDGLVVYIDKRNMQCKNFAIRYDVEQTLAAFERFRTLHGHLTHKSVPEAEARSSEKTIWQCTKCEYRDRCYQDTPSSGSLP